MTTTIVTCEGDVHRFEHKGQIRHIVPLSSIKTYTWSDILKRDIAVHYTEVFEMHVDIGMSELGRTEFIRWVSKEIV